MVLNNKLHTCLAVLLMASQQATAQGVAALNILPAASGSKADAPARLVNGRALSNARFVGEVLVLDVSSLHFTNAAGTEAAAVAAADEIPGRPINPADDLSIKSAQECSLYCALVPGCNAYSYCSNPAGCGVGCPQYIANHPPVNATGDLEGPGDSYWVQLPIQGFGPFLPLGSGNGCQTGSSTGAWPFGMCTLFNIPPAAGPEAAAGGLEGAGWQSGTFTFPAACQGMSARGCESCAGAADMAGCLKCVNETQQDPASAAIRGMPLLRQPADGCRNCYSSRAQAACEECLKNSSLPCHRCPMEAGAAGGPADMDACLSCMETHGEVLGNSCISCSTSPQAAACMTCLDSSAPNVCGVDPARYQVTAADQPGTRRANSNSCIPASSRVCNLCVERSLQKERCLACTRASTYSADCEYCALETDPAAAAACYSCSSSLHGTKQPFCSSCLQLPNPSDRQKCLTCLTSPTMTEPGKQFCLGCATWYGSGTPLQQQCFQCLERRLPDANAYRETCSQLHLELGTSAETRALANGANANAAPEHNTLQAAQAALG